jgi:hypothetical protein
MLALLDASDGGGDGGRAGHLSRAELLAAATPLAAIRAVFPPLFVKNIQRLGRKNSIGTFWIVRKLATGSD